MTCSCHVTDRRVMAHHVDSGVGGESFSGSSRFGGRKLLVKDGWVFEGWIYQHGKAPLGGPVSTQRLRKLIASRRLRAEDLTWKKFARNGESCFSSPVTVAVAIATADRD